MIEKRFEFIHEEGSHLSTYRAIMVDKVTGVNYLFVKSGYGAGLTPLLDAEGKVVVSPVWNTSQYRKEGE